jgi:hypothetical protein
MTQTVKDPTIAEMRAALIAYEASPMRQELEAQFGAHELRMALCDYVMAAGSFESKESAELYAKSLAAILSSLAGFTVYVDAAGKTFPPL